MGAKKKKKKKNGERSFEVKEKTRHRILSLLSFTAAALFVLAAAGRAGVAGSEAYRAFAFLFGAGYYLFPALFFLLSVLLLRREAPAVLAPSYVGLGLVFVSGLGLLDILREAGGVVGSALSSPLVSFFDVYAAFVLLLALFLVALLLILDAVPSFRWIHRAVGVLLAPFRRFQRKNAGADTFIVNGAGADTAEEGAAAEDGAETSKDGTGSDGRAENGGGKADAPRGQEAEEKCGRKKAGDEGFSLSTAPSFGERFDPPPLSLLDGDKGKPGFGDIKANANIIKRTLGNFGINVEMDEVSVGPSVTRYALKPAQGVKLSRIVGLQNDLSLALAAHPIRIEAPIPGRSLVGIEIPNTTRTTVGIGTLLAEKEFIESSRPLLFSLGRSITGKPSIGDLSKLPHLLVAGSTGSGKSVAIHAMLLSLLYRNHPDNLRLILVDPKRVELTLYNKIPHLLTPVITDAKKAILALKWAAREMDRRYDILEAESVRDIASYHANIVEPAFAKSGKDGAEAELPERMPYIIIVIDELADIMSTYPRELEAAIVRLAQMSRATGIHLILSTQRPSVNIITGLIKANIPARMAFQVASQTDSRTILDAGGAEKLLGAGDMLYLSGEMSKSVRLQSAYVSENEIKKVVKFLAKQYGGAASDISLAGAKEGQGSLFESLEKEKREEEEEDELYEEARETVMRAGKASTTFLQRKLRIGYARAARLMDILEERGVVGPADGAKQREVLIRDEGYGKEDDGGDNDDGR